MGLFDGLDFDLSFAEIVQGIAETVMTPKELLGDDAISEALGDSPRSRRNDRKFLDDLDSVIAEASVADGSALNNSGREDVSTSASPIRSAIKSRQAQQTRGITTDSMRAAIQQRQAQQPSQQQRTVTTETMRSAVQERMAQEAARPSRADLWRGKSSTTARTPIPARPTLDKQAISQERAGGPTAQARQQNVASSVSPKAPRRNMSAVVIIDEFSNDIPTPVQLRNIQIAQRIDGQGVTPITVLPKGTSNGKYAFALRKADAVIVEREPNEPIQVTLQHVKEVAPSPVVAAFITEPSGARPAIEKAFPKARIAGDLVRLQQELMTHSIVSPIDGGELAMRDGLLASDPETFKRVSREVQQTVAGRAGYDAYLRRIQGPDGKLNIFNVKGGDKVSEIVNNSLPEAKEAALDEAICYSMGIESMSREARIEFEQTLEAAQGFDYTAAPALPAATQADFGLAG